MSCAILFKISFTSSIVSGSCWQQWSTGENRQKCLYDDVQYPLHKVICCLVVCQITLGSNQCCCVRMWISRHFDTVDRSWQIGVADRPATLELGVTRVPQNSHIQVNNCWPIMQWREEPLNSSNGEFVTCDRVRFLMKQLVAVNTPQWHSELITVKRRTRSELVGHSEHPDM